MAARLRRTFQYPSDDSDTDSSARHPDDELDDEEQEAIVASLRAQNESSIELWRMLFTALPSIALLFYPRFIFKRDRATNPLLGILSITSLACTIYTLNFIPVRKLDPATGPGGRRQRAMLAGTQTPVAKYLPMLNAGLAGTLVLIGLMMWRKGDAVGAMWAVMPAAIHVIVMVARNELVPLDIEALEALRYEYRGA